MQERGTGLRSIDFLKRDAPLGPQDWARQMGRTAGDD